MADLTSRRTCPIHPDRYGVAVCDHCGEAMCGACRIGAMAAREDYCSEECAVAGEGETSERLLRGLEAPFDSGLQLWWRSLKPLAAALAPVAAAIALAIWVAEGGVSPGPDRDPSMVGFLALGLFMYGIALTGTVMSQQHTDLIHGNPHLWALARFGPWFLTWVLVLGAVTFGYFLLIIPGVIAALRLFWADEFSLAHRLPPWSALVESWNLTKGESGPILRFQVFVAVIGWVVVVAGMAVVFVTSRVVPGDGRLETSLRLFVLAMAFFLGYAVLHGMEVSKFYGMRADARRRAREASWLEGQEPEDWAG